MRSNPKKYPSDESCTYIFLDGDEFLWTGTQELYPLIYGKLFAMMSLGVDLASVETLPATHDQIQSGVAFYFGRVGRTETESYYLMRSKLRKETDSATYSLPQFIEFFKELFYRHYDGCYRLARGAKPFIEALSKHEDYRVFVISNNADYAVTKIVQVLGIKDLCERAIGAPFDADSASVPFDKASVIVEIAGQSPPQLRRVFIGGDSPRDMEAALKATELGVETQGFAATRDADVLRSMKARGAKLVVSDLGQYSEILHLLEGH